MLLFFFLSGVLRYLCFDFNRGDSEVALCWRRSVFLSLENAFFWRHFLVVSLAVIKKLLYLLFIFYCFERLGKTVFFAQVNCLDHVCKVNRFRPTRPFLIARPSDRFLSLRHHHLLESLHVEDHLEVSLKTDRTQTD